MMCTASGCNIWLILTRYSADSCEHGCRAVQQGDQGHPTSGPMHPPRTGFWAPTPPLEFRIQGLRSRGSARWRGCPPSRPLSPCWRPARWRCTGMACQGSATRTARPWDMQSASTSPDSWKVSLHHLHAAMSAANGVHLPLQNLLRIYHPNNFCGLEEPP